MPDPGPVPLLRLGRALPLLVAAAAIGGAVGAGGAALRPKRYRAVETLAVLEPRVPGSPPAVDYNLTPIRSYAGLLASPALAQVCAATLGLPAGAPPPAVKVKVPENTRTLELSAEAADPEKAAAFVRCVAKAGVEENRRLNRELARAAADEARAALEAVRKDAASVQQELARARGEEELERKRTELRAASEDVLDGAARMREAAGTREEAEARKKSLAASAGARPERRRFETFLSDAPAERASLPTAAEDARVVREEADPVRDLAEKGGAEAGAEAAAAGAEASLAAGTRRQASRDLARLEAEVARGEARLAPLQRRLEGLGAAQVELEKRASLTESETISRSLELASFAPAVPPRRPAGPSPLLSGAAGAVLAAGLSGLILLSRPE